MSARFLPPDWKQGTTHDCSDLAGRRGIHEGASNGGLPSARCPPVTSGTCIRVGNSPGAPGRPSSFHRPCEPHGPSPAFSGRISSPVQTPRPVSGPPMLDALRCRGLRLRRPRPLHARPAATARGPPARACAPPTAHAPLSPAPAQLRVPPSSPTRQVLGTRLPTSRISAPPRAPASSPKVVTFRGHCLLGVSPNPDGPFIRPFIPMKPCPSISPAPSVPHTCTCHALWVSCALRHRALDS